MKIIIGADFVPTESNYKLFRQGDIKTLFGQELLEVLKKSEFKIFNLETPLIDFKNPIFKCGPNLIAPTDSINAYKKIDIDLLTIANNHIYDQDIDGLKSTIECLKKENIDYVGAGENLSDAKKPYIRKLEDKKIGIYACCEHEFGIASENMAGANPFDALESFDDVEKLKKECDYVIVLYHGGKEHYRYPSPMLQRICRKFVSKGADLVVCQHSHCIGCFEKYDNGTIVYGQGNFLFDLSDNEFWETGMLIGLDDDMEINYIPIIKKDNLVRLANEKEKQEILDSFFERSKQIEDIEFVQKNYDSFSKQKIDYYMFSFSGIKRNFIYKVANKLSGNRLDKIKTDKLFKPHKTIVIQNFIECEAHRELIINGLKIKNKVSRRKDG